MSGPITTNNPPILKLAVPSPLRRTFDYLPPTGSSKLQWQKLKPGIRLRVPFGKREVVAVLVELTGTSSLEISQLRPALEILDTEPLFPEALLKSFNWAAAYYQHPAGEVYSALLPVKLRQGAKAEPKVESRWVCLPGMDQNQSTLLNRAPRQAALFEFVKDNGPVTGKACAIAGFDSSLLRQLSAKGLIEKTSVPADSDSDVNQSIVSSSANTVNPNADQQRAIDTIIKSLKSYTCHLLDGVTGSGKTEVYMQVIQHVLLEGRQALILVPEIGLTPQTIRRFEDRFDCMVVALHSGLTPSERLNGWLQARNGSAKIIIGTRSAIFTPLARPGLIIIDEEHDGSFKQQDGFKYSARDLGVVRARKENINIILGSATPSLESLHNAEVSKYSHLILSQRAGIATKPTISLLDMTQTDNREGFSSLLLDQIRHHLTNNGQVLVFINRRGFAPVLFCQDCGFIFECERCDAQLTVHKTPPALHCHHCESRASIPNSCVNCESKRLSTRGIGTEKTEQFLQQEFTNYPIIRIDRDATRTRQKLDSLLEQIQKGHPSILVGTQMLAKGHHFPKVTLVAVIDADSGLFSPDFRAQEAMIQLLFQVAGRSGREEMPGQVVVQTRHATHGTLQSLINYNYQDVANLLMRERREGGMPPFSHLALIRAEAHDFNQPLKFLKQVYDLASEIMEELTMTGVDVHYPLPSPMEKRAGRYRAQLLLQAQSRPALQSLLSVLGPRLELSKTARKIRWGIDVDPMDLI